MCTVPVVFLYLGNDGDLPPEAVQLDRVHRLAAHRDLAGGRLEKPIQQPNDGGFTRPRACTEQKFTARKTVRLKERYASYLSEPMDQSRSKWSAAEV
jgi:hypothetical protein